MLIVVAACGGGSSEPEAVVRAWSDAVNHGQNELAAELFAPHAIVIQAGERTTLATFDDARRFNALLPCQGRIVALSWDEEQVTATFLLDNRGTFACGGVGTVDTAVFTVRDGKIVVWERLED